MSNKINLDTIDWRLFRSQKLELVKVVNGIRRNKKAKVALDGILALMDYIQDCHDMEPELFSRLYGGTATEPGLNFKCPKCKGARLEEVKPDCTVVSALTRIDCEGDHHYGAPAIESNSGSDFRWYRCADCGLHLENSEDGIINDCEQLSEWLKTRRYNSR